jgi:tyrosyl-tRNA synthetase
MLLETAPSTKLAQEGNIVDILVGVSLATSKREARTFIESGAVEVNGEKVSDLEKVVSDKDSISGLILLKRGKKMLHLLEL